MKIKKSTALLVILGTLLVIGAAVLVLFSRVSVSMAEKRNTETVQTLRSLMPEIRNAVKDTAVDSVMPVLEIDGDDYIGIVEIPAYNAVLPVRNEWDKGDASSSPCRFAGSVYDGSLVIGASDNKGMFDFMKAITAGDIVSVTDVSGSRYSFAVADIVRTSDVSSDNLCDVEYDLTLFARNTYGFDYTVVRCNYKG